MAYGIRMVMFRQNAVNIHSLYNILLPRFRKKRIALFNRRFCLSPSTSIIDIGGYHWFWDRYHIDSKLTFLNMALPSPGELDTSKYRYIRGDGRNIPFSNMSFDIAFSNSVIEHLGQWEEQMKFAHEIARVAKGYFVQTPYKWFPIEPHLLTPFIHWLPRKIWRKLVPCLTIRGMISRFSPAEVEDCRNVRLLTMREWKTLFPDSDIIVEKFLGFPKSLIAVRRISDHGINAHGKA